MAASSSKCTPEELERAIADVDDFFDRIPDECKIYRTQGEESIKRFEERAEKEAKKKKKLCKMPPHQVQRILDYKCIPLEEHKGLQMLEELEGKEKHKDLRNMFEITDIFKRHYNDLMRSYQERIRHEYETNGYVMYEGNATDEEEEEETVLYRRFRGGGGRRRHRPGVTKNGKGGVVKRLN